MRIPINLTQNKPLQRQLYQQIRELIAKGRLAPGVRMPSTRMMAEQFTIARITVLLTYERLIAEGYLETHPSKGTFVSQQKSRVHEEARAPALRVVAQNSVAPQSQIRDPRVGEPDPALFPTKRWRSLARDAIGGLGAQTNSGDPAGNPSLRGAIANWLSISRGIAATPDQVLLFNSRRQALHLMAHLTLKSGSRLLVEDPSDPGSIAALTAESIEVVRAPVDIEGVRTTDLRLLDVALFHVTPDHQRPLGVVLAERRRMELLAWAEAVDGWIIEEDCEGELKYGGPNLPPLMNMDRSQRVVFLGGFHVSLGPWVSVAYLVMPKSLVSRAMAARAQFDDGRGSVEEHALAELISSGGYARHLFGLRKTYQARRDALLAALERNFGEAPVVWGEQAGLHLLWFADCRFGSPAGLAATARRFGLEALAAPPIPGATPKNSSAILLGYGLSPPRQIASRIADLAAFLNAPSASLAQSAD